MPQLRTSRFSSHKVRAIVLALSAIALFVAVAGAQAKPSQRVAKQVQSAELGKTVLATLGGRTLYTLSAEKNGTFICKSRACLADWHPLIVPAGTKPTGPVKLGTVVRPGSGRVQATYHGRPLYSFDDDVKAGEASGEGFKDVGTWHAATVP